MSEKKKAAKAEKDEPEEKGLADVAEPVTAPRGEVDEETGKVVDEDGGLPADHRDIQVAGTRLAEPVEPATDQIVPLPEKPKYGVPSVSTRQLNPGMLPDGAKFPEEPVAPVNLRESIRKGQEEARKARGEEETEK